MTGASGSGRTKASMAGLRPSRAFQPSRGTRARHVETGTIRPPRGAERGLEANGRRFRTARRPREDRHGPDFRHGTGRTGGHGPTAHRCAKPPVFTAGLPSSQRPPYSAPSPATSTASAALGLIADITRLARSCWRCGHAVRGSWRSPDPAAPACATGRRFPPVARR